MDQSRQDIIVERCQALGLTIGQAGHLAGAGPLAHALGLDPVTLVPVKPRRWLWMAAQTSGVGYREKLTPEALQETLRTGDVPPALVSHILHFIEEAPILLVVMSVEEVALNTITPIRTIWQHLEKIAVDWLTPQGLTPHHARSRLIISDHSVLKSFPRRFESE